MKQPWLQDRRDFLRAAALAVASFELGWSRTAKAQAARLAQAGSSALEPSSLSVRQVEAGLLSVGYAELGPADGQPVLLLHGFPYDIHSYEEVAPQLAGKGYRVVVPHLRGHGTTRFLSKRTFRNGQQAAVALDILALMDSLKLERPILAGYDWGARTADIIAALWPQRCKALVSVNGYLVNNLERNKLPLPPRVEWGWWYQYYFSTARGRAGLEANRKELAKLIWSFNSPRWNFDEQTFQRTAASFDNPDYVSIVVHNYRWRLSLAPGEPRYEQLEKRLAEAPSISVPTVTLDGDADGIVPASDGSAYGRKFVGPRQHRVIPGVGHNLPQEAPRAFVDAVLAADAL